MSILAELWRGKDIYRILMNAECQQYTLRGLTVDVGSGKKLASYHRFFKKENSRLECLDLSTPENGGKRINLESDPLPYADNSVDTFLLMNVLEHIYHYQHILKELRRTVSTDGHIIAVIPFLVAYHPDPHDYWRYSEETLRNIFAEAGLSVVELKPFGRGVVVAAFSQFEIILPRVVKILVVPLVLGLDWIVMRLVKRAQTKHYPLGYMVIAKK